MRILCKPDVTSQEEIVDSIVNDLKSRGRTNVIASGVRYQIFLANNHLRVRCTPGEPVYEIETLAILHYVLGERGIK